MACDLDMVDFLVANGADLNARDTLGNTALHLIAVGPGLKSVADQQKVIRELVAKGASQHLKNVAGQTPSSLASSLGQRETAALLEDLR